MCDTDICVRESLKYKGFECDSTNDPLSNCTFKSVCYGHDCGNYGHCQIKANGLSYAKFCRQIIVNFIHSKSKIVFIDPSFS